MCVCVCGGGGGRGGGSVHETWGVYLRARLMHNLCLSFFLGITAVPREIESNAYAKFWILGAHKGMRRKWEMCKGLLD